MVKSCIVYGCTERFKKGGISFHRFPINPELRKNWIRSIRRKKFTPSQSSVICDKHFLPDCFETSGWSSLKRLKADAVPTIFDFPSHLLKRVKSRQLPCNRNEVEVGSEINGEPVIEETVRNIGDFDEVDMESSENAKMAKQRIKACCKNIRYLQQTIQRLTMEFDNLGSIITHFTEKT